MNRHDLQKLAEAYNNVHEGTMDIKGFEIPKKEREAAAKRVKEKTAAKKKKNVRGYDSEEQKKRLEKKRGMKLDDHPQFKKEELEASGKFTAEEIEEILNNDINEVLGGQPGDGYVGHPRLGIKNPMSPPKKETKVAPKNTGLAGKLGNRATEIERMLGNSYEPEGEIIEQSRAGFRSDGRYQNADGSTTGPVMGAIKSILSGNLPKSRTVIPPTPQQRNRSPFDKTSGGSITVTQTRNPTKKTPYSKGEDGKLTDFGAGGGDEKMRRTGMSVAEVEKLGRKNLGKKSAGAPPGMRERMGEDVDVFGEQSSTSTMRDNVTDALPWNRNTKYTTQGKLRKPGENVHGRQTGRGLNTSTGSMGTKTENFEFSNAIHEAYEEDIKEFTMDQIGKALSGAGAQVADIAANHPVATAATAGGALGALTGGKKKVKKGLGTAAGAALGAAVGGVPGAVIGGLAGNVVS